MTKKLTLRPYQKRGLKFLKDNFGGNLFLPPGAGKTAIVSRSLSYFKKEGVGFPVLIVAPLFIIYDVWPDELEKWAPGFKISNLHKDKTYNPGSDIYLINPEKFRGDAKKGEKYFFDFEGIIGDESTMFKNPKAQITKVAHRFIDIVKPAVSIIMTGTPRPKSMLDLYGQVYMTMGPVLGVNFYQYRSRFFRPEFKGYNWEIEEGSEEEIIRRISKKTFIMTDAEILTAGYPKSNTVDLNFHLSAPMQKKYIDFHKKLIIEMEGVRVDKSKYLMTLNKGSVNYASCSQIVNGYIYEEGKPKILHYERLNILENLIESLNGSPLLVLYFHKADLQLFKKIKANSAILTGGMKAEEKKGILNRWNDGNIPVLYAQINITAYGLNMQSGGHNICYFSVPDDFDKYFQSYHRLVRPGQKSSVTIHRIICKNTVDEINRLRILNKKILKAEEFRDQLLGVIK